MAEPLCKWCRSDPCYCVPPETPRVKNHGNKVPRRLGEHPSLSVQVGASMELADAFADDDEQPSSAERPYWTEVD